MSSSDRVKALTVTRGDKFTMLITVTNPDGSPLDVTAGNYTPKMEVRETPSSASAVASFSFVVGGSSNNELTATLTAVDTLAISINRGESRLMLMHDSDPNEDQILSKRYVFTFEDSSTRR